MCTHTHAKSYYFDDQNSKMLNFSGVIVIVHNDLFFILMFPSYPTATTCTHPARTVVSPGWQIGKPVGEPGEYMWDNTDIKCLFHCNELFK